MSEQAQPENRITRLRDTLLAQHRVQIVVSLIAAIGALLAAAITVVPNYLGLSATATAHPASAYFQYQVQVVEQDTGQGIPNARVTIEIPGMDPLSAVSDLRGFTTIAVPGTYAGASVSVLVGAPGYASKRINAELVGGSLPTILRLRSYGTPTPTSAPASTATPGPTSATLVPGVPTDTPAAPPELVLISPLRGSSVTKPVTLRWRSTLQPGWVYQVLAWHVATGDAVQSPLIVSDSWTAPLPEDKMGEWRWRVFVLTASGSSVVESDEWFFWMSQYGIPRPTGTPVP